MLTRSRWACQHKFWTTLQLQLWLLRRQNVNECNSYPNSNKIQIINNKFPRHSVHVRVRLVHIEDYNTVLGHPFSDFALYCNFFAKSKCYNKLFKICYLRYSRLLGLARSCTVTVVSSVEVTICLSLQNPGSSIFSGLGICSFAQNRSYHWATVSDLLCRSLKKSDRERITLISLNKRATVSNLLRSLMTKEPPWGIPSGRSWQKSNMSDLLFFGGD